MSYCTRSALSVSVSLTVGLSVLLAPVALYAHHQSGGTTTTITTSNRPLRPLVGEGNGPGTPPVKREKPDKPEKPGKGKPGSGGEVAAMSSGGAASLNGFSIQSFAADQYTGSSGAEIPIIVPPGAGGVAPKIVLRYNSGIVDDTTEEIPTAPLDQASWTGLGWTLHSGGYVLRETRNTTSTADDDFKLIFQGEVHDLVAIGGGNYRTKDETFLSIKFESGQNQDRWTVITKDGTVHRFGFNDNSKARGLTFGINTEVEVTFRYFLQEAETTSNVVVKYNYFKQSSSYNGKPYDQAVYIDTIQYAYKNNSLIGTLREIKFLRGSRTDWSDTSSWAHTSYHELYRLEAIEVKVGTSVVRRYNFAYDPNYSIDRYPNETWGGGASGDLTLISVTVVGQSNASLPAQTFSYTGNVLGSVQNGIGGSATFNYERLTAQVYAAERVQWNPNSQSWDCNGVIELSLGYNEDCASTPLVTSSPPQGSLAIYRTFLTVWDPENGLECSASTRLTTSSSNTCDTVLVGYALPAQTLTATVPIYNVHYRTWVSNGEGGSWECLGGIRISTNPSQNDNDCGTVQLLGYIYPGKIDRARHRVTSRTPDDGRGWNPATNYHYFNPHASAYNEPDPYEFRGHAKVRAVDPLGNYTETLFHQDHLKDGRAYQTDAYDSAGNLYTRTVNTFSTTSQYSRVTFVKLDQTDSYECEGQPSCHRSAESYGYDSHGNPTHKTQWGDVFTGGDERTEITEWLVDADKWIHRPKRVALYSSGTQFDNTTLVRERWMYYDGPNYNSLGNKGQLKIEEARLTGDVGHSGNPTTVYDYDTYGNRDKVTDARGCQTTTEFDASQALPVKVTNCLGHFSTTGYHAIWLAPTSQIDANGNPTSTEYDDLGRVQRVTGPLDGGSYFGTVYTSYPDWGNVNLQRIVTYRTEQHGTANYIWSQEFFDGLGRGYMTQSEGPDSNKIVISLTTYDSRGQTAAQSAPYFYHIGGGSSDPAVWTTFEYDVLGRGTKTNFPDGTNTRRIYDHHEITDIDRNGNIKITRLDSHHRTSQVEEQNGSPPYYLTDYFYNAADQLIQVNNQLDHNTFNVYDMLGRKVAMCDPNMGTPSNLQSCSETTTGAWVYTYSKAGDMLTQKDAKDQIICFKYDQLGRPTKKAQPGGADGCDVNIQTQWTYDEGAVPNSKGRVTTIVDNKIENNTSTHVVTTKTIAYDAMGRATQTQRQQLGVWRTMTQTYDALSRVTSETFPDGDTVCYVYNTAGSLSGVGSLSVSTCNTTGVYVNEILYNARGQKTKLTYGNGLVTDWTHNANNFRVTTKVTSGGQQHLVYGYDPNGNVTAITDNNGTTAGRVFTYDNLNRMVTATGTFGPNQSQQNCNGATNGFIYNAIGNLISKCGATLSYSDTIYHPSAVTHHSGVNKSYTYDANGNMLTRGNQTLEWTIDNRVARVSIAGGGTTYMEYDYSGMRVKKDAPAGITLYPFAGYEIDPSGVITKFIRAGGETIAAKRGSDKRFYHNDHLGGVNVITDAGGNRCQLIEYDPWGAVSRSEGTCDPDTRFTGQKLDPETGLYYYGGRYYDAEIGRFVSADPFVQEPFDPQNLNRYSYVVNNPQTLVDPTGYFHIIKKKKPSLFSRIFSIFSLANMIFVDPIRFAITMAAPKEFSVPFNAFYTIGEGLVSMYFGNPAGAFMVAQGITALTGETQASEYLGYIAFAWNTANSVASAFAEPPGEGGLARDSGNNSGGWGGTYVPVTHDGGGARTPRIVLASYYRGQNALGFKTGDEETIPCGRNPSVRCAPGPRETTRTSPQSLDLRQRLQLPGCAPNTICTRSGLVTKNGKVIGRNNLPGKVGNQANRIMDLAGDLDD